MIFKIDLKITFFVVLFYFTKQLETYFFMIIFAIIHELGHLFAGLLLGLRPNSIGIKPYGVSISFKIEPKDYNRKIGKSNLLEVKKIIIALAGPATNLLIILFSFKYKISIVYYLMIVYANILLILFNLLPIYPLDGGRILKGILLFFYNRKEAERKVNNFSFIILLVITFISSIGIYYLKNISIIICITIIWVLYINEDIIYRRRMNIYNLINKTIEIDRNK